MGKDFKIAQGWARELWDEFKRSNIRIIKVSEGQRGNPNEVVTTKDIINKKFPELENAGI